VIVKCWRERLTVVVAWFTAIASAMTLPFPRHQQRLAFLLFLSLGYIPLLIQAVRIDSPRFKRETLWGGLLWSFKPLFVGASAMVIASFFSPTIAAFRIAFCVFAVGSFVTLVLTRWVLRRDSLK